MTDQAATPAPTPTPAPAPVAPPIDTQAVANAAAKAAADAAGPMIEAKATEIANNKLKEFGKQLAGEPKEDPKKSFLEAFVENPARVLNAHGEHIERKIRTEDAQKAAIVEVQRAVMNPIIAEYPELSGKKLAFVERLCEDYERTGMKYSEALGAAAKDAVKEFGLKSVSETQRNNGYQFGLPSGGAMSSGAAVKSAEANAADFVKASRDRALSLRQRK